MNKLTSDKDLINEQFDKYISKKKWFILSLVLCFSLAFVYVRYTTKQYGVSANIKIADDDKNKAALSEINTANDYGLFKKDFNSVSDEIEVLKSKNLINKVIERLNLNVQYFIKGKIKSIEIYENPPVEINFLTEDSIIKNTDFKLALRVDSKDQYSFIDDNKKHNFGDRVTTSIGDVIITPNFAQKEMKVGREIVIQISSLNTVSLFYNTNIKISPAGDHSSIIQISLQDPVVSKAKDIVDALIVEYNDYVIENKKQVVKLTSDFINNRLEIIAQELSQVDLTAETAKKDNRLTDLAGQSSIFLQSEKELKSQQISTSTQLQLIDYTKDYLSENNDNSSLIPANLSFDDNSINELTKRHNDLVIQRNRILKSSTIKNPVIVNLDQQISTMKQSINASLSNLKSSGQIRLSALQRENSRISSQIYSAPKKERQFRDLQRQQSIKESLYLYLLEKREESAITNGISSPNAIVIDNAFLDSTSPIWPKKSILFLAALFIGIIIPVVLIYLSDLLDNKIKTKKDLLRILQIPFIGDIPKSKIKTKTLKKVDYSPRAEAFRILRSNIDFMLKSNTHICKSIFITSTTAQEGKSHTSINLASSFSFSEKKVLLIETDIRVPRVNDYLKIIAKQGLTDFISDKSLSIDDVTIKMKDNEFLDVIPSGTIPPNPAELLMSQRVNYLFEKVKEKYDYIIVDTAAVGLVTDTLLISDHADMFVYVVSANNIDERQLHIAQTLYDEKRLPNMAVLLNGTTKKKGYGYGYGSNPNKKRKWYNPFKK
ncbi:MAG: capsular exopolysaccharide synthesis family protein [Patiriisocius sp.]|jgi:capsular exopolysaccharide synthesis family protein